MPDAETRNSHYSAHIDHLRLAYGRAAEACGYDAIIIHAGSAAKQSAFDDQYWPLRPTPAFAHWLPLMEAEATLVIVPGATPVLHRLVASDFWEGPTPPETDHFWGSFSVREHATVQALGDAMPSGRVAFVGQQSDRALSFGVAAEHQNPAPLEARLDAVRLHKTAYEVACIAAASARAATGHQCLQEAFLKAHSSELDLHLLYLEATLQDDVDTPYKNIVAIDRNAATLHHVHYDRARTAGANHSLLVDAGARCNGYASDITRTLVRGSSPGARVFADLIVRIDRLQREICRRVAPGVAFESLHDQAHELLAGVVRELELSSASADELVGEGVTRALLPHGLGHSLGIQVHDVGARKIEPRPENPFLRATFDIAEGMVFTVEPGCYFIDPLLDGLREKPVSQRMDWQLIDTLRPFGGIRIEDNIAVLREGTVNLTRDNWPGAH